MGEALGQLPPEGWLQAVATIWNTRTLRLLSVVSAACAHVTLTVKVESVPPSDERLVGDAGQLGMTTGEQLAGFNALSGSSTW